jgi:PadR family transcriptional regulator PadR
MPSTIVQGTLDMIILKTLALEPLHGYGIVARIEQISGGVFEVGPGSLTAAGRARLEQEKREWMLQTAGITRILVEGGNA